MRIGIAALMVICSVAPAAGQESTSYTYDALGRLRHIDARRVGGNGSRQDYIYDSASNRSKVDTSGPYHPISVNAPTTLLPGETLMSNDTRFTFVFQRDGNFVLYDQNSFPLWASFTDGSGATHIDIQSDGNLVVYGPAGVIWNAGTPGHPGSKLVVQNDGNAVLYDAANVSYWATGTCCH